MSDIDGIGCSGQEHKRLQKVISSLNKAVKELQAENDELKQNIIKWQIKWNELNEENLELKNRVIHPFDRLDI